jgi:hypothetical protein
MFRKRRSIPEVASSNGEGELPAAAPSMPPPPPPVRAILVGPPGETRDWLESFISARPEMRLLGTHTHPEDAVTALKESAGRQAAAVLIDATLREPNEARSVIRTVRDRFPALRIVAYGDDLDEIAIEGLYFIGADAVLLRQMEREEVITAILKSVRKPVNAGIPKIRDPEVEVAKEAPRPDSDIVHVGEGAQVIGEVTAAIEEPIQAIWGRQAQTIWGSRTPAMEEPAPPIEEPAPAIEEPAPAIEEPALAMEEPIEAIWGSRTPAMKEPTPAMEEPAPAMEEPSRREEASRPPRRRYLVRSLGLLRSHGRRRAGRITHRVKPDKAHLEDEQRQAISHNLERLVPPWQSPQGEQRDPKETTFEEPGTDKPEEF